MKFTSTKYKSQLKSMPEYIQDHFELLKQLTRNFTTPHDKANELDAELTTLIELELEKSNKTNDSKPSQDRVRELAKDLIRHEVSYGATPKQLSASQKGVYNSTMHAQVKGQKIVFSEIDGKKVNVSVPLQSIYNEIMDELYDGNPPKKQQKVEPMKKSKTKINRDEPGDDPMRTDLPRPKLSYKQAESFEKIPEEVRFIKRYVLYHGKEISIEQAFSFLSSLQRAFLEKRIRKTSPYSEQLIYIQSKLVDLCNYMNHKKLASFDFKVKAEVLKEFSSIASSAKTLPDTNLLKRYTALQGKEISKEKAKKLLDAITHAGKTGKLSKSSPYFKQIKAVYLSLTEFIQASKSGDTLKIHQSALNGIESVVGCIDKACGCVPEKKSLNGISTNMGLMNSQELTTMEFDTIGFMGKWLDLIGDPTPGFSAMIYGRPKMGKSYLSIDFAGYLAKHHGKTLYIANEEKLGFTLAEKLKNMKAAHRDLIVSESILDDLSQYDFVFIDSVNNLELQPEELTTLKQQYPKTSFIFVFQTTKTGQFRGRNTFQHDVDIVIEVPEIGKAIQYGRYNQGGELNIFDELDKAA